jgi:hypothetical protein
MPEQSPWRDLHRTADQRELTSIVTTIAAMEFDVRCCDVYGKPINVHDAEGLDGPFCVQVRPEDHVALREVLAEIISEQDEFDALVSFSFNVGVSAFNRSDLRTEISKNKHRAGDAKDRKAAIAAIEAAFAKHNTAKGVVVDALTKRRKSEADHFLKSARAELAELEKAPAATVTNSVLAGQQQRSPVWPQIGRSPHFPKY